MSTYSRWRTIGVILALAAVLGMAASVVPAAAEKVVWEMQYTRLHFDWYGTWDKTAWWAYSLYYLGVFDWSYRWAWYGLGWDKLSPLNTAPTGKIDIWFYDSQWGGQCDGQNVWISTRYMDPLDLSGDKWVYQSWQLGSIITHELNHSIFFFKANGFHYNEDRHFTTENLAYYTGSFIYPWYKYVDGKWYPELTFSGLAQDYRDAVAKDADTYLSWWTAGDEYLKGNFESLRWKNAHFTMQAVGYYMYNYTGSQNTSIITNLVVALGNLSSISDAYLSAFGHGIDVNRANYRDPADFYYYFYKYYWRG